MTNSEIELIEDTLLSLGATANEVKNLLCMARPSRPPDDIAGALEELRAMAGTP